MSTSSVGSNALHNIITFASKEVTNLVSNPLRNA